LKNSMSGGKQFSLPMYELTGDFLTRSVSD
jgi:hypothetical protein